MRRRVASTLAVLLMAAAISACGDDTSDDERSRDGGSNERDSGDGSGGHGGRGGRGGRGGAPAAGSGAAGRTGAAGRAAPTVECGEVTCEVPAGGFAIPCCADEAESACGISILGACTRPPENHPNCPSLDFAGILVFPSCCNSRNMCGIDVSSVGGPSCLDLRTAAERARLSGATVVFPAPRACDASAADDAGVSDDAG